MDLFRKVDKKRRFLFYKNELNIIVLKYLINNPILKKDINFNNNLMLNDNFFKFLKENSLNRIVNYCTLTGRSRGILSKFKMSRLAFKNIAQKGWINGMVRSNW